MKDIMKPAEQLRTVGGNQSQNGPVVFGALKKTTEHLDSQGNVIDPNTKQIIKRVSGPDRD